jgi:hypothetical protein
VTWQYAIDPAFEGADEVPGWGVMGGYPLNDQGEVAGEFVANPNYRPSPLSLRLPPPVTELEAALQLAATGYGSQESMVETLRAGTVLVPLDAGTGRYVTVPAPPDPTRPASPAEQRPVVPAYTSEGYLPPDCANWRAVPVTELGSALAGRDLLLNPGSQVAVRIPADQLPAGPQG